MRGAATAITAIVSSDDRSMFRRLPPHRLAGARVASVRQNGPMLGGGSAYVNWRVVCAHSACACPSLTAVITWMRSSGVGLVTPWTSRTWAMNCAKRLRMSGPCSTWGQPVKTSSHRSSLVILTEGKSKTRASIECFRKSTSCSGERRTGPQNPSLDGRRLSCRLYSPALALVGLHHPVASGADGFLQPGTSPRHQRDLAVAVTRK